MSDTLMDFDEAVRRYDPVLGLEVHVELGTATKMFDAAPNVFGAQPNTMVTPTSVGLPGALPVVNARGVEYAIRIGLALGCEIAQSCRLAGRALEHRDDLYDIVLEAHRHANAAERALRMLAQFLKHRGRHIDGVRIIKRSDHTLNRTIDECCRIRRIDIARLDERHYAEEAQDIVRIESRRAQECTRRKYGQHASEQRRQKDN